MLFILAHRGNSAEAPENTLSSITKAIAQGVDYIEIDVHLTKDLIPIVIHDPTIGRTTGHPKNLRVEDTYLCDIQDLDAGSWFHPSFSQDRIPFLSEVLRLDFKKSKLMIEIKRDALTAKALIPPILKVIKESIDPPDLCIGSFFPEVIKEVKKLAPEIKVLGILDKPMLIDSFLRMKVKTLAIWHKIIDAPLIQKLKNQGIEIWTFTVDETADYQKLIALGVDGVISNNPGKLLKLRHD